ncbi:hypothetical protein [Sphingosinithalassobacter portus]|nr:hypothetical protein [Sphingosinithalassobacter portus]
MAKQREWEPKRGTIEWGPKEPEGVNGWAIVGVIIGALVLLGQCAG